MNDKYKTFVMVNVVNGNEEMKKIVFDTNTMKYHIPNSYYTSELLNYIFDNMEYAVICEMKRKEILFRKFI